MNNYNYKLIKKNGTELIAELNFDFDLGDLTEEKFKDKVTAGLIFSNVHKNEHPEGLEALFTDIMNSQLFNVIEKKVDLNRLYNDYIAYLIENE